MHRQRERDRSPRRDGARPRARVPPPARHRRSQEVARALIRGPSVGPRLKRSAFVVYVVAALVRFAYAAWVVSPFDHVVSDMGTYFQNASLLAHGQAHPFPRVMALYPWGTQTLIAGELYVFGENRLAVALVHALVGAVPAPCALLLASRFVRGRTAPLLAGLLVALWQPHVVFAGYFTSEIWFSAAMTGAAWLYVASESKRRTGLLAGAAAAIAFAVRPQMIVTWALALPLAGRRRIALALPLLLVIVGSSVRLHELSGHWGLISENGAMQRVFADTHVEKLSATWTTPEGRRMAMLFAPVRRGGARREHALAFEGYMAEPAIMAEIHDRELRRDDLATRAWRFAENVAGLFEKIRPWPDLQFGNTVPLADFCMNVMYVALPLAIVGLFRTRRAARAGAARRVVLASLAAMLVVGAFYRGEPRFRVPYDPLLLTMAVVGLWTWALPILRRATYRFT